MTEDPDGVAAGFKESQDYERVLLARRRGFANLYLALLVIPGTIYWILPLSPPAATTWGMVSGLVLVVGVTVGVILQARLQWKGVFEDWTRRSLSWKTLHAVEKLGLVLYLGVLFFIVAIIVAGQNEILEQAMGVLLVAFLSFMVLSQGHKLGDRALQALGLLMLAASLSASFIDNEDLTKAAAGLIVGVPLLCLGLFRTLAPKRWLIR